MIISKKYKQKREILKWRSKTKKKNKLIGLKLIITPEVGEIKVQFIKDFMRLKTNRIYLIISKSWTCKILLSQSYPKRVKKCQEMRLFRIYFMVMH